MASTPNSAIRPQTGRRASAVVTAAVAAYSGTAAAVGATKLCDVGANGASWLVKLGAVPRATVAAFNVLLFWSPDGGTTLFYVTRFAVAAVSAMPAPETDFGLTEASFRLLAPQSGGTQASFYIASDTALSGGIVVNAELEDA